MGSGRSLWRGRRAVTAGSGRFAPLGQALSPTCLSWGPSGKTLEVPVSPLLFKTFVTENDVVTLRGYASAPCHRAGSEPRSPGPSLTMGPASSFCRRQGSQCVFLN